MTEAHKNADRFKGFANLYDNTRPACPPYIVGVLTRYLGHRPHTVVDIGCGTGLSTLVWKDAADKIIGVEPSEDMIAYAIANAKDTKNIEFIRAFSDNTGLDAGLADIVTCSQSFHWMEPESTLREVARLLKPGGIFAVYDCDWPPICNASVEAAYQALDDRVDEIEAVDSEYKEAFIQYPKGQHLENIRKSGHFGYTREIVFANTEDCDADRYYNIALSQGGTQAILKKNPALVEKEIAAFRAVVDKFFGDKILPIEFCYRLRMGVAKYE
ncbi:MAG: class I SAM-dependent methyltransferase [Eubacteriales bacterium]|nr:class I SAM-dependent methyltransferase [Eubacteriales bacterium]